MRITLPLSGAQVQVARYHLFRDRPTLVFLHDSLGCIMLWRDFPEKLGHLTGCNVLVYDRQGYGQSAPFEATNRSNQYMEHEADVLHELLTHCEIDHALLFGHSDGGSIALIAAAKHPGRIRGIITEGAHIFVEDITLNGIRQAVHQYQTSKLKTRLQKYHGNKTQAMFSAWTDTWTTPEFRNWNIEHFLPRITCPALIIQGELDEYGTLDQVERIISQTSVKAEKLILPNVGHTPHKEAPELVLAEAAKFVKQVVS